MQMHVIINARAGSVVGADAAAVAEAVAQRLSGGGHDVSCEVIEPSRLVAAFERVRDLQPDVLIVGGGDGSARSAAAAVMGTRTALGILPLGTINRLARDLAVPLAYEQASEALARGRVTAIDVAEVNGRFFLCNAILGLTTRFSTERQKLRGKPAVDRLTGYFKVVRNILAGRRRMLISIDDGSGPLRIRVLSLVVTNNAYADETSLTLHRPELDAGQLAAYAARHASGWSMIASGMKAMLGRLDGDPNVLQVQSPQLTVDVKGRTTVPLSIDGEVEHLTMPLGFAIRPKALKVLVPADGD